MGKGLTALGVDIVEKLDAALSNILRGLVAVSIEDDCAARGDVWEFDENITLAVGASAFFLLTLNDVPDDVSVFINPIRIQSKQSDVDMIIYEGTDYASTTQFTPFNYNRNITRDSYFKAYINPTGTNKGLALIDNFIFATVSGVGANTFSVSGSGGNEKKIVTNKTKKYLLEIKNIGTTTTLVEFHSQIIEYREKDLI